MAFFDETPEDKFKAKITNVEKLFVLIFSTSELFELQAFQNKCGH
jgi:hypothetical protein